MTPGQEPRYVLKRRYPSVILAALSIPSLGLAAYVAVHSVSDSPAPQMIIPTSSHASPTTTTSRQDQAKAPSASGQPARPGQRPSGRLTPAQVGSSGGAPTDSARPVVFGRDDHDAPARQSAEPSAEPGVGADDAPGETAAPTTVATPNPTAVPEDPVSTVASEPEGGGESHGGGAHHGDGVDDSSSPATTGAASGSGRSNN